MKILVYLQFVRVDFVDIITEYTFEILVGVLAGQYARIAGTEATVEQTRVIDDVIWRDKLAHDQIENAVRCQLIMTRGR